MTREEAIKIIESNCSSGSKLREACAMFIPELKESEDERIRKELIQYLKDYPTNLPNGQYTRADFFAYLEKQKEQKPIFKKGDRVIWDGEEFNILDVDKDTYNVGGYIVPFSREGELHPIGQKPAEWSEEDDQYLLVCKNALVKYCYSEYWSYPIVSKWLEEHCKVLSQPHWKPSKEQMECLQGAVEEAESEGLHGLQQGLIDLMESLKRL